MSPFSGVNIGDHTFGEKKRPQHFSSTPRQRFSACKAHNNIAEVFSARETTKRNLLACLCSVPIVNKTMTR